LEIAITASVGAKVLKEGKITVPSRLLCDFVAANKDKKINLSLKDHTLTVKSRHSLAHIRGMNAEEFPLIPKVKGDPIMSIDSSELLRGINQVIIAAAADDTRPVLCGVYFTSSGDILKIVATDSYRLAERKIKVKLLGAEDKYNFIVPLRTMQELSRILSVIEPGAVSVSVNDNQIAFNLIGAEVISRLVDGEFPDYEQIIPGEYKTKAELGSQEFNRTVKMVSLFAQESANSIELNFDKGGEVRVLATSSQIGDNKSTLNTTIAGKDNRIAFNAKFITDVLNVLGDKEIDFEITGSFNPGVIRPKGESDYLYVIMPLKLEE
jgi:DNA polymerase-3 subunit beta